MSAQTSKLLEVFFGSTGVGTGGTSQIIKQTKVTFYSVCPDARGPLTGTLMPIHTLAGRCVVFPFYGIAQVLRTRRLSQIAKTIVGRIAISVVNLMRRPPANHVEPRKAMSEIDLPVYADLNVAKNIFRAGFIADFDLIYPLAFFPPKCSRPWIVIQNFLQVRKRDIWFLSHLSRCFRQVVREPCAAINGLGSRIISTAAWG